jgi:hypothetical protein
VQTTTRHFIVALAVAFVCFGAIVHLPAQTGTVYTAIEAAKHIGENATVTDKVDDVLLSDTKVEPWP